MAESKSAWLSNDFNARFMRDGPSVVRMVQLRDPKIHDAVQRSQPGKPLRVRTNGAPFG
jgi:hypothetical protein